MADLSSEMANDLSNSAEVSEKLSHFAESVLGSLSGPGKDNPAEVGKILDQSSQLVECILTKMKSQDGKNAFQEFLQLLKKNDEHPVDQHNRHVGTLATLVGLAMGLSSQEVQDLAFAGMVHDLYMKELPTAIADRHLFGEEVYMNKMDKIVFGQILSTYKWHIETLVNRLKAMPTPVSEGSIRIIEQHHEHFDGSGLNGLRGPKIYRPAKILRLIDDLVSILNSTDFSGGIKEAYNTIAREHLSGYRRIYDPDVLQAVKGPLHIT
jgi:HD-GYP domain-containing protein (c-di-GMP phosphodiesterase class II)